MERKAEKIVVLTGAGISAESGLKTFRGTDGLWEGYRVEDVATPEAWRRDQELVQRFYNTRRRDVVAAKPNAAHLALKKLEEAYDVHIVTQNIDDLHERAGSSQVLHLHGLITKAQSSVDPNLLYDIEGTEIRMGERCAKGAQLRPHVVWFGEAVPMMLPAMQLCREASLFMVIGTSLQVYPAASLLDYVPYDVPKFLIDPNASQIATGEPHLTLIDALASAAVPRLVDKLLQKTF